MSDNLFDHIPQWLKSLHEMANELRTAARMAQARRHFENALNEAKGLEPANGAQTPLRKGEV
jgi:hypothetical protein